MSGSCLTHLLTWKSHQEIVKLTQPHKQTNQKPFKFSSIGFILTKGYLQNTDQVTNCKKNKQWVACQSKCRPTSTQVYCQVQLRNQDPVMHCGMYKNAEQASCFRFCIKIARAMTLKEGSLWKHVWLELQSPAQVSGVLVIVVRYGKI